MLDFKRHLKVTGAVFVAAVLAWLGAEFIQANRHLVLYEITLVFLLLSYFVVVLRGAWRDVALVGASLAFGLVGVEIVLWRLNNSPTTFREKGMWGIKGELGLSPIRPGVIHEKKVAANGDVIFDVAYTIEPDLSRKVVSPQTAPLIAFFGDSFTYGAGVNDSDTLPQIFADFTKGVYHIVNLGVSGYGPQQMLRALETDLYPVLSQNPRLFVILSAPWHAFRTSCKADNAWFGPSYALENGVPVYKGSCASRQSTFRQGLTTLLRWTEAYDHFIGRREKPVEPTDMDLYIAILAKSAELARQKYGVSTLVLYLPDDLSTPRYQLGPGVTNTSMMSRLRDNGLEVMDLTIDLNAYAGKQLIIPGDGHPTGLLNRIWGERLRDFVAAKFGASNAAAETR
ncbi:MAG: SGNH/GDSL hydrolase family protein [Methylocystis sp.]|uniref:SGNH/GDSL hydrolase family protein n=1 Tax=Methylocystis sp. TaxID=1911079 RepID=UPI003DA211A3